MTITGDDRAVKIASELVQAIIAHGPSALHTGGYSGAGYGGGSFGPTPILGPDGRSVRV